MRWFNWVRRSSRDVVFDGRVKLVGALALVLLSPACNDNVPVGNSPAEATDPTDPVIGNDAGAPTETDRGSIADPGPSSSEPTSGENSDPSRSAEPVAGVAPSDPSAGSETSEMDAGPADSSEPASVDPDAGGPSEADAARVEAAPPVAAQPRSWREGMRMPTARTELAAARLGDRIYVAGGFGGEADFDSYLPDDDVWEVHADMPVPLDHPTLAELGGKIYVTGGRQARMFAYDPATDGWTPKASLPQARYAAAGVTLGEHIYVIGGSGTDATDIVRYDAETDSWSTHGRLAMVRDHVAAVAHGDRIYIMAGRSLGGIYTDVAIYDPASGTVTAGPAMQESRSGFAAASVGRWICVAGGELLGFPRVTRQSAECLDTEEGAWSFVDMLPRPLHGVGGASYKARMYVFGGAENAGAATPREGWVHILEP